MKKLYTLVFLFCCLFGFAQFPTLSFTKTIGGSFDDYLYDFAPVADGYICFGSSVSSISGLKTENSRGGEDYWVIKIDFSGNIIWQRTLGGSGLDWPSKIRVAPDGSIYCSGSSNSGISGEKTQANRGGYDYWIVKLSSSGALLWEKTFGGDMHDFLQDVRIRPDGKLLLLGASDSGISGDKTVANNGTSGLGDFWLLRLSPDGILEWQDTFGGFGQESQPFFCESADGGWIMAGPSRSGLSGDRTVPTLSAASGDTWIIKFDAFDNIVWQHSVALNNIMSLAELQNGDIVVAGRQFSGIFYQQQKIFRISSSAVNIWQLEGALLTEGAPMDSDVVGLPDGGFIHCSYNHIQGFRYIRRDSQNQIVWERPMTITANTNSGSRMGGLKIDANGSLVCASAAFEGISADKSEFGYGQFDYWIARFEPEALDTKNVETKKIVVSPIPAKETLNISNANGKAEIFNALGQKLSEHQVSETQNSVAFPFVSGHYILKFTDAISGATQSVKIIK
ncbi:T9SS type A sorting domain-containing protein [Flavobacterium sp.]|uniref:T9SS type A sorting domain-containing protein n=1 Tax=Flavobacterium sp. TaxID=239 RepID=UPI0011FA7095|nr:T9SS type A sorting domain-containing protein [Flavobacterium sp.]RZJ72176.1 MAG: T9SS type A sorting domain-containing protein [Flavobacterium sp.]